MTGEPKKRSEHEREPEPALVISNDLHREVGRTLSNYAAG